MSFNAIAKIDRRVLLFCLLPILVWAVLYWGFSFNGLYGQDAHEYLRYAKRLTQWMRDGVLPGDYFWPLNYPLYGALLSFLFGDEILSLQLLSVMAIVGSAFLVNRVLQLCWPDQSRSSAIFVGIFFIGSPFLLRAGMLVMSDALAVFFICLSLLAYFQYLQKADRYWLLLAGFAAVSAGMTRYAAAVILLLPGLHLLLIAFRRKHWLTIWGGLVIALIVCLPHVLIRGESSLTFLEHSFLDNWNISNWFHRSFTGSAGTSHYPLPNVVYGFFSLYHPGFIFLGSIFLLFLKKNDFKETQIKILLASIVIYALFLAGIPFQNNRFLLLSFPFGLLLLYPAYCQILDKVRSQRWQVAVLAVITIVQVGLFYRSMQLFVNLNHFEQEIAQELNAFPKNRVYTFYVDQALKSYGTPHEVVNLWLAPIQDIHTGELILFHPTKFQQQWQGHTLMKNWSRLQTEYQLKVIQELPGGWQLYQIEPL